MNGLPDIELERYELFENAPPLELTRRHLFRVVGGGLVVALLLGDELVAQPPGGRPQRGGGPQEIGAWLHVAADGTVTVYSGKVEIGQNVRTSLTQVAAEELRVPVGRVKIVLADTALCPFDAGTFGSASTPQMVPQIRRVAAAAREALIDLAAERAKLDRGSFTVKDGQVVGPNGQPTFGFGDLTKGEKIMKAVAATAATTPADRWTVLGTSVPKVDGRAFVTGGQKYASDQRRPGMLFGKVLRPPGFKATLESVDTKAAEAKPGVTVVHDGSFVAVAAPTEAAAADAIAAIQAKWKETPGQPSSETIFQYLKDHVGAGRAGGGFGGGAANARGSIPDGLKESDQTVKATYTVAYIAHVPLEPRAAVAEWAGDKLTVWVGTQRPFGVRTDLATALKISAENIHVIAPDTGSGYGGKHTISTAEEAARLAKAAGKPVKVVWTREEEFTWGYFRPAGVIEVTAGAAKDGTLRAWEFHNTNSGGSAIRTPYEVANQRTEFHGSDSPLRQGSYRALAATANTFARETAMDELAVAVGMQPLEFRLKNLKDPRMRAVLEAAAKQFGSRKPTAGVGHGFACGTEKGSYVASAAEVAVDAKGQVKVLHVVTAFECGAILNPDHLKNQVEGAVVMGLGGALFERVEFADGKIINPALADYRVPRFKDLPALDTVLLDRKDLPSAGAGETPIIAVAPAIGNAIFQATGVRLRSLPLAPNGVKKT